MMGSRSSFNSQGGRRPDCHRVRLKAKGRIVMRARTYFALSAVLALLWPSIVSAGSERHDAIVQYDNVTIGVVVEGRGPAVVVLPSLARDSDDYGPMAETLAKAGFMVLRPAPRGIGRSVGPMTNISLHDFARDTAEVIKALGDGKAIVVGHAYGNWVARMTATDYPDLVRGVVLAAAAAKSLPQILSEMVIRSADPAVPKEDRLAALQFAFFASGNDPKVWLDGWHKEAGVAQRAAAASTKQSEWWAGGKAPLLDLQAEQDPFKPVDTRNELKAEFGDRVTIELIPNASHALLPEQPVAVAAAIAAWIGKL